MSGSPEPESRHSNGKGGLIHAGVHLGSQLVRSLAPQFLALVILNVLILAGLGWFIDARARHTAAVLNQLLTACLAKG